MRGTNDGDCVVVLDEEDADVDISAAEAQILIEQAQDAATKEKTKQLIENRKKNGVYTGLVNGKFNPLVKTWRYPSMNMQQMVSVWLMGIPNQHVPPLKHLVTANVAHFDEGGRVLNKMKNTMLAIEDLGVLRGVWRPAFFNGDYWNGGTVARLWDGIAPDVLSILKKFEDKPEKRKRMMTRAWRTNADKLIKARSLGWLINE